MVCHTMREILLETEKNIVEHIDHMKTQSITNPSIIYDIDLTLIDRDGNPLNPILRTLKYAISQNFFPVLITARQGSLENIATTISQLRTVGIENIPIYFLTAGMRDVRKYKTDSRKHLTSLGYNIVMSIGDSDWDIGEYGGTGILIPWDCDCCV